nr:glycosyltransferase family A protein [Paraglaciecola sp. MB-3u-78]
MSFIIPHKGRFEMLLETIGSVGQQNFDLANIEIIVVSQTPSISEVTLPSLGVEIKTFIRPECETISALRNFGVKNSTGEFLAFLDADIFLSNNWVESMLSELSTNPNRIITSAVQICKQSSPPLEKIRTHLSNVEVDKNVSFLPGRNLFMSKQSFYKIGEFPEHLVTCEDYFFTDKAAKIGELFYSSAASYTHLGEDKQFAAMFSKEVWRGQSNLRSLEGRKIPIREWPSIIVPPVILICLLVSLLSLILGFTGVFVTSLLLALIPLCAYTIRLWRIAKADVSFLNILLFYITYFPARALGTFLGLFKTITVK